MADNWIELMDMANSKHETILEEMRELRTYKGVTGKSEKKSPVANFVLGGLGKAFSLIGNSLQEHYGNEDFHRRNKLKKVS
ncbi:hypothetical protein [Spirochaeta isovalerica]|uniref:Uncharacterized protein n=1 Tax=Spirochaeta isovalerica TaxID=150 RepID=A0A841R244_9SPIO|nr:hypothetical protein [Spirochaeta isovalerica]MBB6479084.1 hypothetical protein [Spirochaeta isovalerica]